MAKFILSGKCIGAVGETMRVKMMNKVIDKWFDDPGLKAIGNRAKHFKDFFFRVTRHDYDYGNLPSTGKIRKLDKKVDRIIKDLKKGKRGFFPKWFFLPEEILAKNPITRGVFEGLFRANNYFRGKSERNESNLSTLTKQLRDVSAAISIGERQQISFNKARKKLLSTYSEHARLLSEGKTGEAKDYRNEEIVPLLKQSEFKVFKLSDELFRNPDLLKTSEGKAKYGVLAPALKTWQKMSAQLYRDLDKGLEYYIDVVRMSANERNRIGEVATSLERLKEILVKKKNYLPVQALDIFPMFTAMTEKMYEGRWDDMGAGLLEMSQTMIKIAEGELRPSGHILPQSTGGPEFTNYSKDIISVIDSYSKNVARFNFSGRATKDFVSGIRSLGKLEGTVLEKQAQFLADYLFDTHSSLLGLGVKSQRAVNFARTVTAWQFISKLGLNFRTAARNATQSVHNFTYFGVKGIWDAVTFINGEGINDVVNHELRRHGLYFKEARELTSPFVLFPKARSKNMDGREVFYYDTESFGKGFSDKIEKVARVTGKPMQLIENKVNRNWTFKIAFGNMYRELSKNRSFIEESLSRKAPKELSGKELATAVEKEIVRKSSAFGANLVRELHYEYGPFAKPKVLRTPTGAVLGQFATYSINFFNFNRKIVLDAKDEVMSGYWGEGMRRATYLAGIYFITEAIVSPMFNSNISSLVQHDTLERSRALATFLSAEDVEEKQKAYYGKGPIIGTIGGPAISDLVSLGNIIGLYKLDESQWYALLAGYQDLEDKTKNEKIHEVVRTLNTQIYRWALIDAPKIWDGSNAGVQFWYDVSGAYPSKELREIKEKYHVPIARSIGIRKPESRKKAEVPRYKGTTPQDIIKVLETIGRS